MQPKVFICSSTEGEDVAAALQSNLESAAHVKVWSHGAFTPTQTILQTLLEAAESYDFAVLVFTADDERTRRDVTSRVPRDNLLFELGLFMGSLGQQRTFVVYDETGAPTLPSDLGGVVFTTFRSSHDHSELRTRLNTAAGVIRNEIKRKGVFESRIFGHALATDLRTVVQSTRRALALSEEAFDREIEFQVGRWVKDSQDWARGRFSVGTGSYFRVLNGVYSAAKAEIFSTSVLSYNGFWETPFGLDVLHNQAGNRRAKSTRVFLFKTQDDLSDELRRSLSVHQRNRVEVRMFFEDEYKRKTQGPTIVSPIEGSADWTFVDDGKVIGVTKQFGANLEADWYVGHTAEADRFREFRDTLKDHSETLVV